MSEAKVTWFVNGVECEGNTFTNVMSGTTIQREIAVTDSGVVSLPNVPILPVERSVPQSAYNDMVKLWLETRDEIEQLRKRIAELEGKE